MKTLDEIIKRNDYVRVTKQLRERAHELAEIIREKLVELDADGVRIKHENGKSVDYIVCEFTYEGFEESTLTVSSASDCGGEYYDLEGWKCVNHFFYGTIFREKPYYLRIFLNDCRAILEKIDEMETKKVTECEQALKNAEGLK